jgi:hypothetical protein
MCAPGSVAKVRGARTDVRCTTCRAVKSARERSEMRDLVFRLVGLAVPVVLLIAAAAPRLRF